MWFKLFLFSGAFPFFVRIKRMVEGRHVVLNLKLETVAIKLLIQVYDGRLKVLGKETYERVVKK